MTIEILVGDVRDRIADIPDRSVHTIVTSPPYFGLRDYGVEGQIGLEPSLNEFIDAMVMVGRELWRVLRDDGTFWLNIGDSYAGAGTTGGTESYDGRDDRQARMFRKSKRTDNGEEITGGHPGRRTRDSGGSAGYYVDAPVPAKNLLMVPARLALALQDDGWILRSDIIWHKPNPMPESVTDRPTSSHEHIYLFSKSRFYYYDADAVRQPAITGHNPYGFRNETGPYLNHESFQNSRPTKAPTGWQQGATGKRHNTIEHNTPALRSPGLHSAYSPPGQTPHMGARRAGNDTKHNRGHAKPHQGFDDDWDQRTRDEQIMYGANLRNVWSIATHPFRGAHFATFPPELPKRCILAGTSAVGVCPACGAPWKRSTAVGYENPGNRSTNGPRSLEQRHETAGFAVRLKKTVTTTGWAPTCTCDAGDPVPATVFDPFGGAMTTMVVADWLGRDGKAIELNPEYAELGRQRLTNDAPLFAAVNVDERGTDGTERIWASQTRFDVGSDPRDDSE